MRGRQAEEEAASGAVPARQASAAVLIVENGGFFTTVQDLGRPGYRASGVPPAGAMDPEALRIANRLVGNPPGAAALEITLAGPALRLTEGRLVALMGAPGPAEAVFPDGRVEAVPFGRPFFLPSGGRLRIGRLGGARAYVAVAGGIAVPPVLSSRSTYLPARFGGLEGRRLVAGDRLPLGGGGLSALPPDAARAALRAWGRARPAAAFFPAEHAVTVLRFLPGPEWDWLTEAAQAAFLGEVFTVSPASNRMGARLKGPPLPLSRREELFSAAVDFGVVQLPPGGGPIVLLSDHQTTGGYPRIGAVIAVDRPLLAQLRPGDRVAFYAVGRPAALRWRMERRRHLRQLEAAIALRWAAALAAAGLRPDAFDPAASLARADAAAGGTTTA
ncbi:biotin-dependent carboxyltransferase family protein [Hydrogenibacillus sp. N12]|uniref:5-oxoprolinase subunit C family protein n=1 Tax=Hydrogenibacillus sp. N12 TaxID=2866627 RepID=UPI001C7D0ADF|nr:biotin-dependent carboxyltransferase family protein [Hydrogenibacillus sp. N12]QZA33290.1 biotin-dependent carboxyltransferase family protein [Hydrogenibacillus sp. N12]